MQITEASLKTFHQWMMDRGRSEKTADNYRTSVRACGAASSLTARLVRGDLAPISKHVNRAALVAWAKYSKQPELAEIVREIKLPPAKRVALKLPLEQEDWKHIVTSLATIKHPPLRAVCLIIARRGLRVSDALYIKRAEVVDAVKTGKLSYVGKGSKRHVVSAAPVLEALELVSDTKGWTYLYELVVRSENPATAAKRVRRTFKRCAAKLEVDNVHPHRFRRTYATTFLKELAGDPQALIKLQHHMGWSNLQTAAMYADAVDADELAGVGDAMTEKLFSKQK